MSRGEYQTSTVSGGPIVHILKSKRRIMSCPNRSKRRLARFPQYRFLPIPLPLHQGSGHLKDNQNDIIETIIGGNKRGVGAIQNSLYVGAQ